MGVEVAVPKVIHCAARATHDDGARIEKEACPDHGRDWCDWAGERSGEDRAEHAREEEVVCTDWFVEAYELSEWNPGAGENRKETSSWWCVWGWHQRLS